jgi:4-carboxymuconolactone decarboxylase
MRALQESSVPSEQFESGLKLRREVLGDEYVDKAMKNAWPFAADFHKLVTEVVWGTVWNRPGLARRERSLITLGLIAALNRPEVELHIHGALRNGCTPDEIKEVFMHIGVYCGAAAGLECFRAAHKAFAEAGITIE